MNDDEVKTEEEEVPVEGAEEETPAEDAPEGMDGRVEGEKEVE